MKEYIAKYKKYIFIFILLICIVSIILFLNKSNNNIIVEDNIKIEENNTLVEEQVEIQNETLIEAKIKVDIKGSITNPGVYEMNSNDRVIDVINKAGGLTKNSDVSVINLSKKLFDEMTIIIYTKDEVKKMKESNVETIIEYVETECDCSNTINDACIKTDDLESNENDILNNSEINKNDTSKISINLATKEELDTLPGIGLSKAEDIINYREANGLFKSVEEIKNVSGIGDSIFEKIKDSITV